MSLHHKALVESIAALQAKEHARWDYLSDFLSDFHENLPKRMADLASKTSGKQHMLFYWLETAAFSMAQRMLQLWYQLGEVIDKEATPEDADTADDAMRLYRYSEYR